MKKTVTILFFVFTFSGVLFSQSNPLDKKIEKAYDLVDKGKLTEADDYLVKLLKTNPRYGKGWDYLAEVRHKKYKEAKQTDNLLGGNITVTTKDKNGKEVKGADDSLTAKLTEILRSISPSKTAWNKYIFTMRQALLNADDAYTSSFVLRSYFVDIEIDTAVSKKALKQFDRAEEEFSKKNYENAAKYYKRAVEEQPDFYKASLYMGDCFYFTENYVQAIESFKYAVEKFPFLVEPRKYLIDAYLKEKLYKNALEESIKAMAVYPDLSIPSRMEDAAYFMNKTIDLPWTPRAVFPNKIVTDSVKPGINDYTEKETTVPEPWTHYVGALSKIKTFCNKKGIVTKTNVLTNSKYMEVYGWEEMLKNTKEPSLDQARKMQKEGYLDCYVLVTCFHFDFYDQYLDFVKNNKERVIEYYNKYLMTSR